MSDPAVPLPRALPYPSLGGQSRSLGTAVGTGGSGGDLWQLLLEVASGAEGLAPAEGKELQRG